MKNITSGTKSLPLVKPDAGGNMGYSLSFDFEYNDDNPGDTIEYSNIKFSGPGSWADYSEGDEYPYAQMYKAVMNEKNVKQW